MKALWSGIRDRLHPTAAEPSPAATAAFEALIAPLPPIARDEFTRRAGQGGPLPQSPAALFETLRGWAVGAGIAEGRGGYPGGRGKPGWTDYVERQRRHVAIFRALVDVLGEPSPALLETFRDYERNFPASVRRMGEGWEPIVNDVAGRLIYSQPVESGFASMSFSFPIDERDLRVLLADPWRRAVLEVVGHAVLQRSMMPGNPDITEQQFRRISDAVLHSAMDDLKELVVAVDRDHHTDVVFFAEAAMRRRAAAANPGGEATPRGS